MSIDNLSLTSSITVQAAAVLDKLQERQDARRVEREQRLQQTEQASDPREDVNTFLNGFISHCNRLQEQVCKAATAAAAAASAAGQQNNSCQQTLLQHVEQLSSAVCQLEQDLAAAAYFLPPYDLRSSTASLQDLRKQLSAIKQQLAPKKKFAFTKAITRTTTSTTATAAAAPASTAAGSTTQSSSSPSTTGQQHPAHSPAAHDNTGTGCQTKTRPAPPAAHDLQLIESGQGCMGRRGCVIIRVPQQLSGQIFVLHDLKDCTVLLLGQLSALRLQQLQRCRVVVGPVNGATFINGAEDCLFMIASHQVRVHDAQGCDLYLRARSRPVIEDSSQLRFAPFPVEELFEQWRQETQVLSLQHVHQQLPSCDDQQQVSCDLQEAQQLFAADQLAQGGGGSGGGGSGSGGGGGGQGQLWQQVDDFGWVKSSQSPNWSVLPPTERQLPSTPGDIAGLRLNNQLAQEGAMQGIVDCYE